MGFSQKPFRNVGYREKSLSTGCSFTDFATLHRYIKDKKPKEILECGTGISTIVMAYALKENAGGGGGRIISMESVKEYYDMAVKLLPASLSRHVEIVYSPVIEDSFSFYRGVRYRDVPLDRQYDFMFIDGPSYVSPTDGAITFDFDYIHVVKNSDHPVYAIIDKRMSTCYVIQKVFGVEKLKYDPFRHLGFVGPCTRKHLRCFNNKGPSFAFDESRKLLGITELHLKFDHLYIED